MHDTRIGAAPCMQRRLHDQRGRVSAKTVQLCDEIVGRKLASHAAQLRMPADA
jgi:hypothetical protein